MNTEELTITIKVDDKDASSKLDELRDKIEKIENLSRSGDFQHLKEVASSLTKIANSATNLGESAKNLKSLGDAANHLAQRVNAIKPDSLKNATSAVRSFGNAMSRLKETGSDKAVNIGPTNAAGIGKAADVAGALWGELKTAYHWGSKVTQLPFKMMFTPLKGAAARVQSLAGAFTGLLSKIGRVALMRGIRGAIRMVTQAIKEGVTAVYDWADAVGNSFVGTMNSISTSLTYFRNSIGAAISPILDAIAPVLDAIIDKCVAVINVFNQLIATLTGASTWRKAEKVATSFGGATNNAAKGANNANKAAKELKRTLLGFDEINRLDAPDTGSGSGGSGGGGGGGSSGAGALAFSEQPISSSVKDFAQKLKGAWEKVDFTEIGTIIGEKIGGALLSVPWESKIQPTTVRIAKSFGTLLNGMFDYGGSGGKAMWDGIAYTAYNALNTAMLGYVTFFNTVNWNGIGQGIGAALKKVLTDGINWDLVAQSLSAFPNAVIDAIDGFCSRFKMSDFSQAGRNIGTAVADAIINIKWGTLFSDGARIAQGILRAVNGALEAFGEKWGEIKTGIVNGIKKIPAARWEDIGYQIGRLLVNAAKFIFNIVDTIVQALEKADWNSIIDGIGRGISENIDWGKAKTKLGEWLQDHFGTVSALISVSLGLKALKSIGGSILSATLFGNLVKTAPLAGGGTLATLGTVPGFLAACAIAVPIGITVVPMIMEKVDELVQKFVDYLNPIISPTVDKVTDALTNRNYKPNQVYTGGATAGAKGAPSSRTTKRDLGNGSSVWTPASGDLNLPNVDYEKALAAARKRAGVNAFTPKQLYDSPIGPVKLDVTANMTNVTDSLTSKQKTVNGGTLTVQQAIDSIKNGDKSTKNWTAIYDYFKGKGVTGSKISNFTAEYTKKIGSAIKAFILKGNTAQYDKKTGSGVTKFTLGKNTAKFDYKTIGFKIGLIPGFTAGIKDKDTPNKSNTSFWTIAGFTASVALAVLGNLFVKKKAEGGVFKNGSWHPITAYASGGMPSNTGQMFIAREAGPELVGTIGGSTAVMNNDQIVASVSAGVARAVAGVLGGQGDTPIEVIVKLDSEVLYRATKKGERKANGRYGTAVAIG